MPFKGPEAYDDEGFFSSYLFRRNRAESPNHTMEEPAFYSLAGSPAGKEILEIGCGDGSYASSLLEAECASYTGIEGSQNMARQAQKRLENSNGTVIHSRIEDYEWEQEKYDLILSRLVLHYIEDLGQVFSHIYSALKPGGRLVISLQHPLLTSSFKSMGKDVKKEDWIVDDYFLTGKREEPWIGGLVVKYHRTVEDYFTLLQQAGLAVEGLKEAVPEERFFKDKSEYERRRRIPLFLLFSCRKS
ncbi:class I SAM-dependent methyltransferase [Bacillus infantis]|uniref:class I SAM-dependent methyltransferase n=1 Tax=Bacillus infantis TaxID=324767 RepID=UPI00215551E9|nr:class I SAM-dependent methyltransferase [Bacillus infantis]MCR6610953.1 class I SAM-dependent methyltransferase [Bacillus infantis]